MLKQLRKKLINSGTNFNESFIVVNIFQLLDKKIITDVKIPPHLDFFRFSTTEVISEDNLSLQVKEIVLNGTEQCQQNTHFIRNFLGDM